MLVCKGDERVTTGDGVAACAVDVDDQWKPRRDVILGVLENVVNSAILLWDIDCIGDSRVAAEGFEGDFPNEVGGSEEVGGEVDGVDCWWCF